MNVVRPVAKTPGQSSQETPPKRTDLPFDCVALLLQGGGALGAYQGGVYEALIESGIEPNWIAGISIGAMNAAIIAGNPREKRVERLRQFWEKITLNFFSGWADGAEKLVQTGDIAKSFLVQLSAGVALTTGANGFFKPRPLPPWMQPMGSPGALSYYDTSQLRETLSELIDFDLLNSGQTQLSIGAVNIRTGNFNYFDTRTGKINVDHVMASGALPPGFPPIEIDGELYWDGGLVSNTPLSWLTDTLHRVDTLAFQVDLWSAEGDLPHSMTDVMTRQKEIQYSSRTRAATNRFKQAQRARHALAKLSKTMPADVCELEDIKFLSSLADDAHYNIVHLIYHSKDYEGHSKDYEFSRLSMEMHWQAGYHDTIRTLRHPEIFRHHNEPELAGVFTFDLAHPDQEKEGENKNKEEATAVNMGKNVTKERGKGA